MKDSKNRRRVFLKNSLYTASMAALTPVLPLKTQGVPRHRAGVNDRTWVTIEDRIYGARPDDSGPLGGGNNYTHSLDGGDITVNTLDELITGLKDARPGQIVFIPENAVLDFTTYIYIDAFVLEIPEGVTLAGNRGIQGSEGALLTSDALKTPIMIRATGPDVRITGLRIQGPNPKRYMEHHAKSFGPGGQRHEYYYKFPVSAGVETEHPHLTIDNCEISAFSRAGISLKKGGGHHVHHNFIHNCQYNGLGYGISHDVSASVIEYNRFNNNRHSIAGTGRPGSGYIARHNLEMGISLSHCFDMHGGRDRKDGSQIAGTRIEICNNTFRAPEAAIGIRGVPEEKCVIYQNWFAAHNTVKKAVRYGFDNIKTYDNIFNNPPTSPE